MNLFDIRLASLLVNIKDLHNLSLLEIVEIEYRVISYFIHLFATRNSVISNNQEANAANRFMRSKKVIGETLTKSKV